jgi:hypothetical protein
MHPAGEEGPPDTFGTFGEPVEEELQRFGLDAGPLRGEPTDRAAPLPPTRDGPSYGRFLAVAAALVPFLAAAWILRSRRR